MLRRSFIITLGVLALAAACGGDKSTAPPPPPSIAGRWIGTSGGVSIDLTLALSGQTVSGNGSMAGPGGSAAMTVSGTFTAPTASLTLAAQGFQPANFTGTVGATTMTGTLNGSGFTNDAVTFTRQ